MDGRTIVLGALLSTLFIYSYGLKLDEAGKAVIEECRTQNNLEMDQIKEAVEKLKLPETENGKCFMQCVMEKTGLLEGDNFNAENAKKLNNLKLKDKPDILEKANMVVDRCAAEVQNPGGKCEYAAKLGECALKYGEEMGIPKPTFS